MKTMKFSEPGWVKLYHPRMENATKIEVEKGQFVTISISDKPPEQKKSEHEKHNYDDKKKPDPAPPKSKITFKDVIMFLIIAALLGMVISLLSGNDTVQQETPKLIPNSYELMRSY